LEQHEKTLLKKSLIMLGIFFVGVAIDFAYGAHVGVFSNNYSKVPESNIIVFLVLACIAIIPGIVSIYYSFKRIHYRNTNQRNNKIETYEDALRVIGETTKGFYILSVIQFVLGALFLKYYSIIADSLIYILLAFFLKKYNSRFCAIVLFLISLGCVITTFLTMLKVTDLGGTNIILAVIMLIISIRSIKATYLIHKLKNKKDVMDIAEKI